MELKYPDRDAKHFLNYCPIHCPCGYPCAQCIDELGNWHIPASKHERPVKVYDLNKQQYIRR